MNFIKIPFSIGKGYTQCIIEHRFLTSKMKFQIKTRNRGRNKHNRHCKSSQHPNSSCTWLRLGPLRPPSGDTNESLVSHVQAPQHYTLTFSKVHVSLHLLLLKFLFHKSGNPDTKTWHFSNNGSRSLPAPFSPPGDQHLWIQNYVPHFKVLNSASVWDTCP